VIVLGACEDVPNKYILRIEVNRGNQSVILTHVKDVVAFNIAGALKRFTQIVEIRKLGFQKNALPTRELCSSGGVSSPKTD
jgi:hypothetical protein